MTFLLPTSSSLVKLPNDSVYMSVQMDQIIASPDGTISSTDALNTAADLEKKMSITHAEELLKKLVKDKWMSEVHKYVVCI